MNDEMILLFMAISVLIAVFYLKNNKTTKKKVSFSEYVEVFYF
jgi:hypothetical protein